MEENNKVRQLLETGAEIVGATTGGLIGLIAGPAGAIGGGIAGVIVSKSLCEFADRFLSKREQARIGAAAGLAVLGIEERIKKGNKLREDDFFESDDINRSKAEELFEGILIKCKNEYEEKKIQYITKLYENVAFDKTIRPENANFILNTAQQLSYRQLVIIAMIGQNNKNTFQLRDDDYRNNLHLLTEDIQFILQDFMHLYNLGIIRRNDSSALLSFVDVAPAKMVLSWVGHNFFTRLNLYEMPKKEFSFLFGLLPLI